VRSETPERLTSLDVFRGITIAGMILVNNPGGRPTYKPLEHAEWNGWTPTDLVFPFFLFIVGVAMTFAFDRRLSEGRSRAALFGHVVRRTIILFSLGLIAYGFPDVRLMAPYLAIVAALGFLLSHDPFAPIRGAARWRPRDLLAGLLLAAAIAYWILDFRYFDAPNHRWLNGYPLRVPGVLQRIAVCYLFASVITLWHRTPGRVVWVIALLAGYWAIVAFVHPPAAYNPLVEVPGGYLRETRPEGVLHNWIDERLLGGHLYRERPDPEGVLSTLPAVATTLLGVLTGTWLRSPRDRLDKVAWLFVAANVLLFIGLWAGHVFPINKKIWTSSYVLLAAGLAIHVLTMCYWLVDVKNWRRWTWPFLVFGTNAIAVFLASGLLARLLTKVFRWDTADGRTMTLWAWIYENAFRSWASPANASLAFAVAYVLLWLVLTAPLYRRRIFIRV